jgi:hypothetical protein
MAHTIEWDPPWGLHVRFRGVVTPDEFEALNLEITSSDHWDDLRYVVGDFTEAEDVPFDPDDARTYVDPHTLLVGAGFTNRNYFVAIVSPNERFEAPLRMAIAAGVYPPQTAFFRSDAEARDWLGAQTMSYRRRKG